MDWIMSGGGSSALGEPSPSARMSLMAGDLWLLTFVIIFFFLKTFGRELQLEVVSF
jgi:hypothetical protein